MNADFGIAVKRTLGFEGGDSDHPNDPGGKTRYGISQVHHPDLWRDGPPSLEDAMVFYRLRFWAPLRCGELESQAVANELFDTGVNMGPVRAAKFMQKAYNRLKPDGWDALTEDGIIGAKSTAAINRMCRQYEAALHNYMNYLQAAEYDRLEMPDFLRGWFASRIQAI